MSASRRYRRRVQKARLEQKLTEADNAVPTFVSQRGPWQTWHSGADANGRGGVMFVIPALLESYGPELRAAIACRRSASLHGVCECCGGRRRPRDTDARGIHHWVIEHEADCTADDESIADLLAREAS